MLHPVATRKMREWDQWTNTPPSRAMMALAASLQSNRGPPSSPPCSFLLSASDCPPGSRPDALEQSLFARDDSRCRELAATRGRCINKTSITIQFPGWGSRKKVLIFWVRLARVRTPSLQNDCNEEFHIMTET